MNDLQFNHSHPTTVVFDLDGLIFNTEEIFLEATNQLLAPFGKKQTPEVVGKIMGLVDDARRVPPAEPEPLIVALVGCAYKQQSTSLIGPFD